MPAGEEGDGGLEERLKINGLIKIEQTSRLCNDPSITDLGYLLVILQLHKHILYSMTTAT